MNKKYLFLGSRVLLGLLFFVFGLNGFLQFLPMPAVEMPPAAQAFMGGLMQTGYFFPFLKLTEVICGVLLTTGFFAPLALAVISPVVLNIVLYHRLLAGGPPLDLFILALLLVSAWGYRDSFRSMLQRRAPISNS